MRSAGRVRRVATGMVSIRLRVRITLRLCVMVRISVRVRVRVLVDVGVRANTRATARASARATMTARTRAKVRVGARVRARARVKIAFGCSDMAMFVHLLSPWGHAEIRIPLDHLGGRNQGSRLGMALTLGLGQN